MRAFYPCVYHIRGEIDDLGHLINHKGVAIMEESTATLLHVLTEEFVLIAADDERLNDAVPYATAGALIYDPSIFPRIIGTPV